ncbi:MAG: cellulose biosynthesis cyclic di-GMP-binding regulatory protein BcsB [Chloroflexaceae bacterium]|nr:cellulose biosynthesis cyclic di-GMP-binding regulatory protein BcsB [Chloroflexaceae bacterium]
MFMYGYSLPSRIVVRVAQVIRLVRAVCGVALLVGLSLAPGYPQAGGVAIAGATSPPGARTIGAAPEQQPVLPQNGPEVAELSLEQLDLPSATLKSPLDQHAFNLTLPYRWLLTGTEAQNYLVLRYDMFDTRSGDTTAAPPPEGTATAGTPPTGAVLSVFLNEELIATFSPTTGADQTRQIPIRPALLNERESNRHSVRLVFRTWDCSHPGSNQFTLHRASFFHLEYQQGPMSLNLAEFPRPLVQDRLTAETVLLVLPDDYNDADLSAAASVAAAFGRRVEGKSVVVHPVTAENAPAELLADKSAVIIGTPERNRFLAGLYERGLLPTTLVPGTAQITTTANLPIYAEDGVLQLIPSEVNPDYAYLIVTGQTDMAIRRAAQALSAVQPRYGLSGQLSVIQALPGPDPASEQKDTFTLNELGYYERPLYGIGTQQVGVSFFVPASWRFTEKPTLDLRYFHSSLLNSAQATLNVLLNENPVGNAPLHPQHQGELQVRVEFSEEDFRMGQHNYLSFESIVNLPEDCIVPVDDAIWMRILGESILHLPHTTGETLVFPPQNMFSLFTTSQDLSDVWLSLPGNPAPEELDAMVQMARLLGENSGGGGFAPHVSRGAIAQMDPLMQSLAPPPAAPPAASERLTATTTLTTLTTSHLTATTTLTTSHLTAPAPASLESFHLITFGLPTANPVLAELNAHLPQPFVPGTSMLNQQVGDVVYRLSESFSLGLVQFLLAPWNQRKAVATVTGTNREGVGWAAGALTDDELSFKLQGDVNFIVGQQIEPIHLAELIRVPFEEAVEEVSGEEVPEATVTPEATRAITLTGEIPERYLPQQNDLSRQVQMVIAGLIGAGMLVGVAGVVVSLLFGKKRNEVK